MKKTTALITALLILTTFSYSSGMSNGDTSTTVETSRIVTLIINANVTVVLVNKDEATPGVMVDNSLVKFVTLRQTGDVLVINSAGNRSKTKEDVIYVPANRLREIKINSDAHVRSFSILQIPKLDVIINGACNFAVSNIGEVNLIETDNYFVEQTTKVRRWPAAIIGSKEL